MQRSKLITSLKQYRDRGLMGNISLKNSTPVLQAEHNRIVESLTSNDSSDTIAIMYNCLVNLGYTHAARELPFRLSKKIHDGGYNNKNLITKIIKSTIAKTPIDVGSSVEREITLVYGNPTYHLSLEILYYLIKAILDCSTYVRPQVDSKLTRETYEELLDISTMQINEN